MKYIVTVNGKKYEVEVEKGEASAVFLGETSKEVVKQDEPKKEEKVEVKETPKAVASGNPVKAPMPGVIVDIKVSLNQEVKEGDVLFILEAMKMENEIPSPFSGKITSIPVQKGGSVQTDQILATIQ